MFGIRMILIEIIITKKIGYIHLSSYFLFSPCKELWNEKSQMEGQRGWDADKQITHPTIWPAAVQKVTSHHQVSSLCLLEVPNAIFKPRTDFENIFLLLFVKRVLWHIMLGLVLLKLSRAFCFFKLTWLAQFKHETLVLEQKSSLAIAQSIF